MGSWLEEVDDDTAMPLVSGRLRADVLPIF